QPGPLTQAREPRGAWSNIMTLLDKSPVLREMVESHSAQDPAGVRHQVHSGIHVRCAEACIRLSFGADRT
ncbi:MAG TPA: hypothetical protein VF830_02950, partial [Gemmatimonadales bacterium]